MISLGKFLECVQENVSRIHGYESGHDGSDGTCDCIGLIIGALALAGFKWPGVHGSNWAARNAMSSFGPIADAGEIYLGEIVYKAREPGEAKYDLPDRYKDSGDVRDYYHVGVVTCADPLCITHCTSVDGGIQRDSRQGNWKFGGQLKYVDYAEGVGDVDEWAIVTADSGKTVNLRKAPDKKSAVIARVPVGTRVRVLAWADAAWRRVEANGKTGYMMAEYLRPIEGDGETVTVPRETLETWAVALEEMAREIRKRLSLEQGENA